MPPANPQASNDAARATTREMFGMSLLMPEPEVLKAELQHIGCKTLAALIAKLIAENEPLLKAKADGATVTVRVIGEPGAMRFTVESER